MAILVAACIALALAGPAGSLAAAPLAERTDAQLAGAARELESEAIRIGDQLLASDAEQDEIALERDVAQQLLGDVLADAYKRSGSSVVTEMLAATSLREVGARARVAEVVARHHARVVDDLDDAEARLSVGRAERAQLIARLGAVQARLLDIRAEQDRRAAHRAALAAEREAKERAARDATAALVASQQALLGATLPVGGGGASSGSASAASIDAYLAGKGSPMAGQGAAFVASGERWRVDPRLLVAIAGAESNFGEITCGPHNAWGWACPNDPADFATWAAGIDTVTRGLRRYYLDEGRTSVSLIQQKYCPVGAANDPTGLNNHWSTNVTRFLVEQGGDPASVGPGPSSGAGLVPDFGGLGIG